LAAVRPQDPTSDGRRRVYASRARQWLLAGGLLAVYLATISFCWQADPDTGQKPLPGDYLPIVIPGSIALLYLVWRALKARVETSDRGVDLVKVVGHDYFPWSDVRAFEVLPSPSRRGYTVRLRQQNETLVIVRNELNFRPLRDLEERRRLARVRAEAFRDELEADRRSRLAAVQASPASASTSPSASASASASVAGPGGDPGPPASSGSAGPASS
jgi:hypothetical protein